MKNYFVLTFAILLAFASCVSNRMINVAYSQWESGNYLGALDNATSALTSDPNNDRAKLFLASNYQNGIELACQQINNNYRLEDPQKSKNVADGYETLVKINTRMSAFSYPLIDKNNTIKFTPTSIVDFTPHLQSAKSDAVNAFLTVAKRGTKWETILEYGTLALNYAPTQKIYSNIKETVSDIFYQKALAHKAKATQSDYLIALEGFTHCQKWNPSYRDCEAQIKSTKEAISQIYYDKALALSKNSPTRSKLKEAITALEAAKKYSTNSKIDSLYNQILDELTIYIYPVFDFKDYELVKVQVANSNYPNDLRGLYLSKLERNFSQTQYVKFDNQNRSFANVMHPYILQMETQGYSQPQFIKSASEAKITFLVKMDIACGDEAKNSKIQTTYKDETKSRAIQKEVVIVKYIKSNGELGTVTITPPSSAVSSLTGNYLAQGEMLRIANQYGAKIPTTITSINAAKSFQTDYVKYIRRTENYHFPIEIHWELIDVETKNIVKSGTESKTVTTQVASYTYKILENKELYDTKIDGPTTRSATVPQKGDMVKNSVEPLFESLNTKVVSYIKSQL